MNESPAEELTVNLGESLREGLGLRGEAHEIEPIELAQTLFPWPWVDYQQDILYKLLEPGWTRTILLAPPRHRKPLDVNALILMHNGSQKKLGDIFVGDKIVSGKGDIVSVTATHDQGLLPTLNIKTVDGNEIISAYDHPFLVLSNKTPKLSNGNSGWKNAGDLSIGEWLVTIPYSGARNDIFSSNQIESINEVGYTECRCLSVSKDSSFVANGFVVHNTTILSVFIAIFVGRDPARRVMVVSHTKDFAALLVSSVVKVMESPIYKRSFGDLLPSTKDGDRWTTYEKHLPHRPTYVRDPTFMCLSPDSGTPGYGADLVVCDDITTQANSSTPTLRKHITHWVHGSLLKRLEPDGKFLVNGNRFYVDDFYGEILRDPGKQHWRKMIYPATPDKPLWPERWGVAELNEKKLEDPIFYYGQYELNPLDLASAGNFDSSWFQFYTSLPERLTPFAGIDLPIKKTVGSKYAEMIVARDPHGIIYVIDGYSGYHDGKELPVLMDKLQYNWKPVEIAWENNGPQQVVMDLTAELIKSDARFHGIPSEISKDRRLASIAGKVRTGQILIPGQVTDSGKIVPVGIGKALSEAWKAFPVGDLDLLDAFEKAITLTMKSPPPAASSIAKYDSDGLRQRDKLIQNKKAKRPLRPRRKKSAKSYSRVFRF